jgi:2-methylisocitrate lyase-like PEP mutase family enzyme
MAETKSAVFRELHQQPGQPLILANVWDAGGARLLESFGAKAVATTSAGVAWSLGYADGNMLPVAELVHRVRGIVRTVSAPVTIDAEAGYATDPGAVARALQPLFETGIAGINIEDGADAPDVLARKLEAIKRTTASLELDVFVNVRTDVYLRQLAPNEKKVAEVLKRANVYRDAGADGLFVPGLVDAGEISAVVSGTPLPLNVMVYPGLPKLAELARLGVRRLSAGTAISQATWHQFGLLARRFLAEGDSSIFGAGSMSYAQLQALFAQAPSPVAR